MILKVTVHFKDMAHGNKERLPGTYLDVSDERAKQLIKAKVAEPISILALEDPELGEDTPKEMKLEDHTVAELKAMAEEAGIELPKKYKKADLIDLLK